MKNLFVLFTIYLTYNVILAEDEELSSKIYNKDNFSVEIVKNNHFVMFYAPWCTYCKRLHPTWEELAEMLNEDDKSQVTIAKVDCTLNTELCSEHDITGYPTLLFFEKGKTTGTKFRGTRDLPSLTTFINVQLGSDKEASEEDTGTEEKPILETSGGLIELTESTFEKHVEKGSHFVKFYAPWCGHCQKLAPTWDSLANAFDEEVSVSIAKVDCTQHRPICQSFEVRSYPTLLWIENGKKVDQYKGARTLDDLKDYVKSKLTDSKSSDDAVEEKVEQEEKKDAEVVKEPEIVEPVSKVVDLTSFTFETVIESGFTFVKFYAPWCGHCKQLAPTWEELAKKTFPKENVKIAKVDCTLEVNRELCNSQEVDGYPTIVLYRDGKKLEEYNGTRSLEDLFEFITGQFHDEL